MASKNTKESPTADTGAGLKAVWYGAETFGNLVGMSKQNKSGGDKSSPDFGHNSKAFLSRDEAIGMLREDYDCNYFVSGKGDMSAYAPDCTFADPFVSFDGVKRFQNNVSNLGGLMEDINLTITDWEESEDSLVTSWRFSCILDLPWKPKLAAAGGTTHVFEKDSGLVVKHIERWDIEPSKVIGQLLRPAAKFPTSKAEVLMMSLSEGDVKGVWFEISPSAFKISAAVVIISVAAQAVIGDLQGIVGNFQTAAEIALVISVLTEIIKLVGQLGL